MSREEEVDDTGGTDEAEQEGVSVSNFQVSKEDAACKEFHICCLAGTPYLCCFAHYYMRYAVHEHLEPGSGCKNYDLNYCLPIFCPALSADGTSDLFRSKYGLEPQDETWTDCCSTVGGCLDHCAPGLGIICDVCVSAQKLAQVNHEIKYQNRMSNVTHKANEKMQRE
jgi:hypothetical protein